VSIAAAKAVVSEEEDTANGFAVVAEILAVATMAQPVAL
jgi:hypothetical protein